MTNILTLLMVLPLMGAGMIALFAKDNENGAVEAKYIALGTTIITLVASLFVWANFNPATADFQFVERYAWFDGLNISYHLGLDGISLFMVLLTTLLMPICILCSWKSIEHRVRAFMICFLVLESLVIGVFCALDLLLFYILFEGILIPMYLIIGIWGGKDRVYAAFKFFLYTLAGSVLFLAALVYVYMVVGTTDIPTLMAKLPEFPLHIQQWLWLALFASFAVKVPMWPVHTWLPDAHVQAPTAGSVILAGILLKLGAYGFLRFSLPMLPEASHYFAPLMFTLSIIAIVYTSLVALVQEDMKKLIAYSSVAHMGFVTLGIFTFNQQGVEGAIIQMISHGLVSGALFLCVGVVYDRLHTREIARYGGVASVMPKYAMLFMFFTMASVGLPSTSGFVGEFLVLLGTFERDTRLALLAASGMVLGAAYALWLYRKVMFGEIVHEEVKALKDVNGREWVYLVGLAALVLWLGIYPASFLEPMHASVTHLLTQVQGGV
jgi:NADH-quinone oxidoreductase subunit M